VGEFSGFLCRISNIFIACTPCTVVLGGLHLYALRDGGDRNKHTSSSVFMLAINAHKINAGCMSASGFY